MKKTESVYDEKDNFRSYGDIYDLTRSDDCLPYR